MAENLKTKKINKEKELEKVAEKLGVDFILLFGSRADGSHREESDFDIAYRAKKPLGFLSVKEKKLSRALREYFGSDNLHLTQIKKDIKPLFLYEIMNNCKVIYARDMMDFYNLRIYAFRRFEDEVKPLYEMKFERLKAEYLPDK
jgi:predicted nucleotidyltransferase